MWDLKCPSWDPWGSNFPAPDKAVGLLVNLSVLLGPVLCHIQGNDEQKGLAADF